MGLRPDVEQAVRSSGVVWVALEGRPPRALWHVWHDSAVHVLAGGTEQPLPGAETATRAVVSVRGRGSLSGLLAAWEAQVQRVAPGTAQWDAVVPLLVASRLNATDGAGGPQQWADESVLLRLVPAGG